jgi:excisionase family DNA binding protein
MIDTATIGDKPPVTPVPRLYLRPDEAAAAIGVSRRTLSEWQANRVIPFRRVGRTVLFAIADIQQALDRFNVEAIGESTPHRKRRMGRIMQEAA